MIRFGLEYVTACEESTSIFHEWKNRAWNLIGKSRWRLGKAARKAGCVEATRSRRQHIRLRAKDWHETVCIQTNWTSGYLLVKQQGPPLFPLCVSCPDFYMTHHGKIQKSARQSSEIDTIRIAQRRRVWIHRFLTEYVCNSSDMSAHDRHPIPRAPFFFFFPCEEENSWILQPRAQTPSKSAVLQVNNPSSLTSLIDLRLIISRDNYLLMRPRIKHLLITLLHI